MLIGYSLHLIYNRPEMQNETQKNQIQKNKLWKAAVVFVLFCILIIFLWQYDLVPLQINAQINTAEILANSKQCDKALSLMEKTLKQHSFLDSYERMQYVEFTKACVNFYPDNKFSYIKRGFELIQEAVKTQPLYTRYWLSLGDSTTSLASQEQVASAKNNLLKQANDYFDKALQLGPKHQEIRIGQTKMEIIAGDYKSAENYAKGCIALDPGFRDCYWYLGLAEIYAKDMTNAQKNIQIASDKFYEIGSKSSLGELSDAYISISDYQDLVSVYQQLIKTNPNAAQYHSSLAFIYKELGKYAEARQEALKALELSPESKPNVDAFLKSLPY
jgi:tetratricopeptide (TPR) repeat protein